MNLREYINTFPRGQRGKVVAKLAEACSVTSPCIWHYCNGIRKIPAKKIMTLVEASGGVITVEDVLRELAA
jgi:DNA-binding transcriptional regulator YdaS (Cro superfamily)